MLWACGWGSRAYEVMTFLHKRIDSHKKTWKLLEASTKQNPFLNPRNNMIRCVYDSDIYKVLKYDRNTTFLQVLNHI